MGEQFLNQIIASRRRRRSVYTCALDKCLCYIALCFLMKLDGVVRRRMDSDYSINSLQSIELVSHQFNES